MVTTSRSYNLLLDNDALRRRFDSGSLHGLWPSNCKACPHDYPYQCSNKAFDNNAIAPETLQRMSDDWPSGVGSEEFTAAECAENALNAATLSTSALAQSICRDDHRDDVLYRKCRINFNGI